jgi:glycerophosphoryl diester phosphodiesterase
MTAVPTLNGGRPKVIAHRGASESEPEHTLGAYQLALQVGADGVECDVRLTADRHLVCVHDRRVNRTSDGKGVVSALELAQLEGMDWGSWKERHRLDDELPDRNDTPWGQRFVSDPGCDPTARNEPSYQILTLRRLIRTVAAAGRPVDLVIETKHPTRYSGEVERRLVQVLDEFGLLQPNPAGVTVRMMSFSATAVQRMARLAPRLERVQLTEFALPNYHRDGLPPNVEIVGPWMRVIRRNPEFVAKQHRLGHQVHVWTVDKPQDIQLCLELGVDAIISNRPAVVRAAVDQHYA